MVITGSMSASSQPQLKAAIVYFICSCARSPKTAVIPGLYLIAFVDLVPIATEKVSRIRSNIIWNSWKSALKERFIRVNLNQGTEM